MKLNLINDISNIILKYCYGDNISNLKCDLYKKIEYLYNKKKCIEFVLPAFPGKSPNLSSSFGFLPDNTEIIAIARLESLVDDINEVYPFGCKVNIIHDGHFFYSLDITRSEYELNQYIDSFKKLTSKNIKSYTIYDLMGTNDLEVAFNKFKKKYYCDVDFKNNSLLSKEILFTKYEFKDILFDENMSKNQIQLKAKRVAKESLIIKEALANLIDERYGDCVRLSVHYQTANSNKIGIKLIENAVNRGTPWFYIMYKATNGNIILGKKDWNVPTKKEKINDYGLYYTIDNSTLNLFLEGKLDNKINMERQYNR